MNGFKQHNIDHLSASSLNLYVAEPALWVMERLLGKRAPVGVRAHGGTATEAGVTHGLMKPGIPNVDCQEIALKEFTRLTALSADHRKEKEREAIPAMVRNALKELRQYGKPSETQRKINLELDGVPVPFIGYIDYEYANHGLCVDLKTTMRMPSEIGASHARQGAIYGRATNFEQRFAYTTPKKIQVYPLHDVADRIAEIINIAQRMERFLSISKDAHELAGLICPNYESFYWNEATARANGRDVYGF
ncbi:MAG: PD-(D/E)XK nuclease family protein [Pseudomonadota bacterium]